MPKIPLTDWQKAFVEDDSQARFLVASRQSGKSHVFATDSVLSSLPQRRNLEVILSRGERQSLEVMEKAKLLCRALNAAFDAEDSFWEDTSLMQHSIAFPNGNRIIGLPANPDTARGYSGNLTLDEFAIQRDSEAIWKAAAPIVTRGYRIKAGSTFKGTENRFYQIGRLLGLHEGIRPERQPVRAAGWSGHWVDIHMAAAQNRKLGLKVDVESLRQIIGDEDVWAEEFLNVPISDAADYISSEMVLACESDEARLEFDWQPRPGLCAGWDFARKRDRSVIFLGLEVAGLVMVVGVIYLSGQTFAAQESQGREVAQLVDECGGTFSVDAGGNGAQIAETLQAEFACVDAVQFAGTVETDAKDADGKRMKELAKVRLAREAKRRFEEHTFRIPESQQIRRAVRAIKRMVSPSGNVIIDAARTEAGHGDEFWALALLNRATEGAGSVYVPASKCGLGGRTELSGFLDRSL